MPRLVAQSSEFEGQTFTLTGPEITVGRLPDNKIQVEHASVSGHHAVLKLNGLDYTIKDLESTNGTRINGERITEQKLRRNDSLRLGNIELLYDSEHQPPGQPMPTPSERVNLAECTSKGRPETFTNAAPVAKRAKGMLEKRWALINTVLFILALAGTGYFAWQVFFKPPDFS
ncbi:MAG: FHA domain-containing protein [Methylacidiphilales bacterium]|nr:FHA domain-containing protein [Candidatus Methylacidiphilales bacterium]